MQCKRCGIEKEESEFYARDKTCKECRKKAARENRAAKAGQYREYDKQRYRNDPMVRERHERYAATDKGKAAAARAKRRYAQQNPVKRAAHVILGNAIRDGKVTKSSACEQCGSTDRIHGHHDDYAFPLAVRWLCQKCHRSWHEEHGEAVNG